MEVFKSFLELAGDLVDSALNLSKDLIQIGFDTVDEVRENPGRFMAETIDEFSGLSYVEPIKGSVVYCNILGGIAEHSGIYVGDWDIVHMNGDGLIEKVSPNEFLARLGGANPAYLIYVSCDNAGSPVGRKKIAKRALKAVGEWHSYNIIFKNCHHFTSGCITGHFDNSDFSLKQLKRTCYNELSAEKWNPWRFYK